jgi:peptide deformylase
MAILPIKTYGDAFLRKKIPPLKDIDKEIRDLAKDMFDTLKSVGGVGLAATQVGQEKRIFVIDRSFFGFEESPWIIVNSEVVQKAGEQVSEEGCLSLPGLFEDVSRPNYVMVKGFDLKGKELIIEGKGLLARVLLHELDHLDGVLFIDHLSPIRRKLLEKHLKKLKEKSKWSI